MGRFLIGNVYPTDEYLLARCAPAGHGWGESKHDTTVSVATVKETSVFVDAGDETPTNDGIWLCAFYSTSSDGSGNYGYLTAYCQDGIAKGCICYRLKTAGTWGEWQWENPPMEIGVEYRTTERWIGKPVYTKLIDCGNMLNAEPKTIAHGCEAIIVVRCHGATNLGTTIPYRWNDYYLDVSADRTNIHICTNADFSGQSCMVKLYYTKN